MKNKNIIFLILATCLISLLHPVAVLGVTTTVDTGVPLINEVDLILEKPQTKISIPGLNFSEIKETEEGGTTYLFIPFLGEYIAAAYKYGVAIASIFAVVMIINAGFGIVMSGGSPEKVNHSKTRIMQSMVGLFLAVGSYVLLYTINPNLVEFKSLKVQYITGIPLDDAGVNETKSFQTGVNQDGTISGEKTPTTPTPKSKGHVMCGTNGGMIDANTGKQITQSEFKSDGPWPIYEADHGIYTRKGKYTKPDLIIIHATDGTRFLDAIAEFGGPAVHYVIDRNGDIAQTIKEENVAWSVKSGDQGGTDAAKRSISYEIVNLNSVCTAFKTREKPYRFSGNDAGISKIKNPRCFTVTPLSPQKNITGCTCSTEPDAQKIKGWKGPCWEEYPEEQLKAVASLTAKIAAKYGIPIKHAVVEDTSCKSWNKLCWNHQAGIVGHSEIQNQTHGDPGPAFNWDKFIKMVNEQ
jgi:N-acetyl-anhydromuramyl-L-alanine amidase AmpD